MYLRTLLYAIVMISMSSPIYADDCLADSDCLMKKMLEAVCRNNPDYCSKNGRQASDVQEVGEDLPPNVVEGFACNDANHVNFEQFLEITENVSCEIHHRSTGECEAQGLSKSFPPGRGPFPFADIESCEEFRETYRAKLGPEIPCAAWDSYGYCCKEVNPQKSSCAPVNDPRGVLQSACKPFCTRTTSNKGELNILWGCGCISYIQ